MSTYAQSIDFLLSQVRTSAGALTGGAVYAYAAGTDELKIIWLDRAKTLQAANPYTLDGNGTAALFGDGLYRILIKTSAGVTVYDRDNINIEDVSSAVDAAISSATTAYLVGHTAGCDTLAEAVATIGSTPATLQYGADQTLAANIEIPSTLELMPFNGAVINHGAFTISYAGSTARWPMTQIFDGTGAVTLTGDMLYAVPQWFGALGDGAADDTVPLQKACDAYSRIYTPPGTYMTGTVYLNTNQEFFGAGQSSILRRYATAPSATYQYLLATNAYSMGTADPAENKRDIYVHDLQLDGMGRTYGALLSFYHSMTINATSNMTVERVTFYDFLGDGIYIGSGTNAGVERHNQNIKVMNCIFDGRAKNNRNGISVIDCDRLIADKNQYLNIGNSTASMSVGGFDIEPEDTWNIVRHVKITNSVFKGINSTNTGGFTFFNSNQSGRNIYDVLVEGNTFDDNFWGISSSAVIKDLDSADDGLVIINNRFLNSANFDIHNTGLKGVTITGNTFEVDPVASASYRGSIKLGTNSFGVSVNAIDTVISNNKFKGLRPQFGLIAVYGARGLAIRGNRFEDITGTIFNTLSDATAGTSRYIENVTIADNIVTNRLAKTGAVSTTSFIASAGGINTGASNSFINSTNTEWNNHLGHGITKVAGGVLTIFKEGTTAAAPTSGTWAVGNKLYFTGPGAGSVGTVCSVAGTFGTLTAATGDATNGSATLLNVVDPDVSLREGQYITIAGDAVKKQVLAIDGTTVYLSGTYTGVTGTGLALAWSAPTFVTF